MATELTVRGMTCEGCEDVVEHALELVDAVESADADRYDDLAVIEGDNLSREELIEKVEMAGYEAE